jgi:hypothetical protein
MELQLEHFWLCIPRTSCGICHSKEGKFQPDLSIQNNKSANYHTIIIQCSVLKTVNHSKLTCEPTVGTASARPAFVPLHSLVNPS